MAEGEAMSYRWTLDRARQRGSRRAVRALERIGPPPYAGDLRKSTIAQRRYLARFGGEVYASRVGAMTMVVLNLVFSRQYTVSDRVHYFRGIFNSMDRLWPELLTVNLLERVPCLGVPVFFMEAATTGRYRRCCRRGTSTRWTLPGSGGCGSSVPVISPTPRIAICSTSACAAKYVRSR